MIFGSLNAMLANATAISPVTICSGAAATTPIPTATKTMGVSSSITTSATPLQFTGGEDRSGVLSCSWARILVLAIILLQSMSWKHELRNALSCRVKTPQNILISTYISFLAVNDPATEI